MIAGALVVASSGTALAGSWYYDWSCAGRCAPGRLTIEGREGPFESREMCDWSRDRDTRADEFVAEGNLGGLTSCYESQPSAGATFVATGETAPAPKVRLSAIQVGLALGPGWQATGDGGAVTSGAGTVGIDLAMRTGRDFGGGVVQLGLHGTQLEAPMLGTDAKTSFVIPAFIGLVVSPRIAGGEARHVRAVLAASIGGFLELGCSGCAGPVFDDTLGFGYTLEAGLDVYTSRDSGFNVAAIFPRWEIGAAGPGNLLLEPPSWMVRLSLIGRPAAD
ncbi:MAG TPA: hypothetical protein VL463_21615 [Kofleriaceae bacterium]|nr:hypothetical protein [Kofleriaceae bacterium]